MLIGIVAVDRNNAIGKEGKLPWHYSADMKFFKETTTGHAVAMGSNTWRSLQKKPLPNRLNIVITRNAQIEVPADVVVSPNVESTLALAKELTTDVFVIGGAKVYQSFLSHIEKWLVTEVPLTVEGADTFMPANFLKGFTKVETREIGDGLKVVFYLRS
jgi:dihydrofolate reductase